MTITREMWDQLLPCKTFAEVDALQKHASRATCTASVAGMLEWMGNLHEREQASRFDHVSPTFGQPRRPEWNPIKCGNLSFKSSDTYLTAEGWPLGTTCWFSIVDCSYRVIVCAPSLKATVYRTVILIAAMMDWREREQADPKLDFWQHFEVFCEKLMSAAP